MPARGIRDDLPKGTVTLLFTDVEGSTKALRALGPDYPTALARHRTIIRSACAAYSGIEVDTQGDAFLFAFPRARSGLSAAVEAQRALAAEPWPSEATLRVRMGLHAGEPLLHDEGYVGVDVHLAARICALASGGQILASRATVDLAGAPPTEAVLRDLGEHRLRDFEQPQRLVQVDAPGLVAEHPPLASVTTVGLPNVSNRLVGREEELTVLRELLAASRSCLVTVTGAGGTGKSRLALELAWAEVNRFLDGVVLVRLAPVTDATLVPTAIAEALGVRDDATRPLLDAIAGHLREHRPLVVLDNVEHVLDAAPSIGVLLAECPDLKILATGRSPLRISGEHVVALDPLPEDDAVELFVERARAVDRRFDPDADDDAVREICRRLDGLPLAIELAAARIALLPARALLERLDLALLSGGPADRPARQQTLRATIDWSYGLLTPQQRDLHMALAVFAGGCSLEAVEAVSPGVDDVPPLDDLDALVAGSLLRRADAGDELRFRMLEVVRQYALEQLARTGDEERRRATHAAWVTELASLAEVALLGPDPGPWPERLERELPNIRAALDWCDAATKLRIVSALGRFWRSHGRVGEARARLAEALPHAAGATPEIRASGLWWAGHLAMAQGDAVSAETPLTEAATLFRDLSMQREEAFALAELGLAAAAQGDLERAERHCTESLAVARDLDDDRARSAALGQLAHVSSSRGEHARARDLLEEALALRRRLGHPLLVANSANNLGVAALAAGDLERAREALEEALGLAVDLDDAIHVAAANSGLGQLALLEEDNELASRHLRAALDVYVVLDDARDAADCISGLALVALGAGDARAAARLWGCADRLRDGRAGGVAATLEEHARAIAKEELGAALFAREGRAGAALTTADAAAETASLFAWAPQE